MNCLPKILHLVYDHVAQQGKLVELVEGWIPICPSINCATIGLDNILPLFSASRCLNQDDVSVTNVAICYKNNRYSSNIQFVFIVKSLIVEIVTRCFVIILFEVPVSWTSFITHFTQSRVNAWYVFISSVAQQSLFATIFNYFRYMHIYLELIILEPISLSPCHCSSTSFIGV